MNILKPKNNLDISREDMPQIKSKYIDHYIEWLENNGILVKEKVLTANKLKPAQDEINKDKIKEMSKDIDNIVEKPLVISNDRYILDGLHRWATLYNKYDRFPVKVLKVGLPFKKLINITKNYEHAKFEHITESKMKLKNILELTKKKRYHEPGLLPNGYEQENEVAPPGREDQIKKLKKVYKGKDPSVPYKIAWAQHEKNGKPDWEIK